MPLDPSSRTCRVGFAHGNPVVVAGGFLHRRAANEAGVKGMGA